MFRSIAIVTLCLATVPAHAALLGRAALTPGGTDYQAYYDTDLNITWAADASLNVTSGYINVNFMTWTAARTWATSLNQSEYLGIHLWRLPRTIQTDTNCELAPPIAAGYNCTGSELGHLFYTELGGVAGQSIAGNHNSNYGLFQNIVLGQYWSSTTWASNSREAYTFAFHNGDQWIRTKDQYVLAAWAVAPGDPLTATIPISGAPWLFGSALGVMGWMRRKSST